MFLTPSVPTERENKNERANGMKYDSKRISIPKNLDEYTETPQEGNVNGMDVNNKENNPNSKELPNGLREKEDPSEIYRIVSSFSNDGNEANAERPKSGSRIGYGNESPKVVNNPWTFFNRFGDNLESRYDNEEDEERDRSAYVSDTECEHAEPEIFPNAATNEAQDGPSNEQTEQVDHDGSLDNEAISHQPVRGQSFTNFLPAKFGGRSSQSHVPTSSTAEGKVLKPKRKFQFFSRKPKNKGKRQGAAPVIGDDDSDNATGERAQLLIGSLIIGSPAINLVASCLLEDERGIARSPLLLTLLGFKIVDISHKTNTKNRKFRIDLEYGVGPQRLKWSVEKTAKDLLYLHSRFKFDNWKNEVVRNKNSELPKYPIPPLRHAGNNDSSRTRNKSTGGESALNDLPVENDTHNDNASIFTGRSLGDHFGYLRAQLSAMSSISSEGQSPEQLKSKMRKNDEYINQVTRYLNELIKLVALKPQSNKLFQFFEISPISSLLSYETGFIGKQGVIHIGGTAKSQGWRVGHFKANDLKGMIDRRSEKWLLIRGSYIMYVADINATSPLEVFIVDSKFRIHYRGDDDKSYLLTKDEDSDYDDSSLVQKVLQSNENSSSEVHSKVFKHLNITLENAERKLVLIPKSHKEQKTWIKSLMDMKASTVWSDPNRFGSFAPIRQNCFAQWFVDGRDYFWAVSSALEMAKDVIFIHDWWLSPELYLRRPANGNQQWRIDRILQRKAQQGVKIFVIIYRNVGTTVATDSLYTKHSILSLNEENIHVIRSPNQLLQNTYFWAHHEKLCIIDQTVAFLGGIDLCYGRYDTPDHVLVDDSKIDFNTVDSEYASTSEEFIRFQTFPGKDYSNPRMKDFFGLDKPYESMYDRNQVPRMPWHDVHMVTSGKVARDLSRHFVQRWNYLIRQKRPSRFTPLLTPPPDFSDEDVAQMGLGGTCEVQLLRSSGNWSLGLQETEKSIQNAYLKLIETSEHFVYIENQFFVTSCVVDGNEIQNRIGDALVDRIIRAHNERTNWRAIIVIPLMPGFESQVDEPDGSSVRVIMQCQFMSISRQLTSIFAKLKKFGIEPDDYIQFFSLRKWGRIGPDRTLVTEQLYIHAKTMIVDDRAAIIGSANINERSMRGSRDSEVAAVVRDNETVKSRMNGEEYLAGKFAYTLRMRLMREHLGVNVDILDIVERRFKRFEDFAKTTTGLQATTSKFKFKENVTLSAMVELASRDILNELDGTDRWKNYQTVHNANDTAESVPLEDIDVDEKEQNIPTPLSLPISFTNRTGTNEANKGIRDKKKHSYDARVQHNETHRRDVFGDGPDKYKTKLAKRARLNSGRFLKELANKAMTQNPTAAFLPGSELIREFLESDDSDMIDEMDEESEKIISERNRERWALLKRISYLQRVAAKTQEQTEEESKKRVAAGMEPLIADPTPLLSRDGKSVDQTDGSDGQKIATPLDNQKSNANQASVNSNDRKSLEPGVAEAYSEDIPIVSLDEQGAREVVHSINPKGIENFSTYVDPYGFEDPLDEDFYEDIWYENARRNTEIFRMIFHTQPDNAVVSWKDYKQHSKLQRAFLLSQLREAKTRRKANYFGGGVFSDYSESVEESENDENVEYHKPDTGRKNSQATINVKKMGQDVGLLGEAPPSGHSSTTTINGNGNKSNSRRAATNGTIPEEEEIFEDAEEYTEDQTKDASNLVSGGFQDYAKGDVFDIDVDDQDMKANGNGTNATSEDDYQAFRSNNESKTTRRRRRRGRTLTSRRKVNMGERIFDRDSADRILREIQGHLVIFPADWLMRELEGGNWFYNTDRIPPIDIYD